MNKKILMTIAVSVIFISAVGFIAFSQFYQNAKTPLDSLIKQESKSPDSLNSDGDNNGGEGKIQESSTDGTNLKGVEVDARAKEGLIICADKCGDGICQSEKTECTGLNCTCQENLQECPQDCKK